jgi:dCMP deaminase
MAGSTIETIMTSGRIKERPSWEIYFMEIASLVAKRSTCLRRSVGAVLVKDKRVLTTGYNGAPSGLRHCLEVGCLREKLRIASGQRHELCRGIHAEQNAIIQAACHGVSIKGAALFCTNLPCVICTKMLINSGITKIFYQSGYPDSLSLEMLQEANVALILIDKEETGL